MINSRVFLSALAVTTVMVFMGCESHSGNDGDSESTNTLSVVTNKLPKLSLDVSGTWAGEFDLVGSTKESGVTMALTQSGTSVNVKLSFADPTLFGNWPNWETTGSIDGSTLTATAGATTLVMQFSGKNVTGTFEEMTPGDKFTGFLTKQ